MQEPGIADTAFEVHFPVTVMQRDFTGVSDLNDALAQLILGMEEQFRHTENNAAKLDHIATEGGYQTTHGSNLFHRKNEALTRFRTAMLMPAIREYLEHVFEQAAADISPYPYGWANILRDGDWQRPHNHASHGNIISGVYYVQVPQEPEPKGCIDFLNPVSISTHHGYSPCRRVQPQEGKLILFPPYHVHWVHPVTSSEPRIIIAFDVMVQ